MYLAPLNYDRFFKKVFSHTQNDIDYIETEDEHIIMVKRTLDGVREDALAEGIEKGEQIGLEKGEQIGLEKAEQKSVILLHKKGKTAEEIADLLEIPLEKVKRIIVAINPNS